MTLQVDIGEIVPGPHGACLAGGWESAYNERLRVVGDGIIHAYTFADGVGVNQLGHSVALRPFLGVMGMPPDEPGEHSTIPPRRTRREPGLQGARERHDALPADRGPGRRSSPPATATPPRATARSRAPRSNARWSARSSPSASATSRSPHPPRGPRRTGSRWASTKTSTRPPTWRSKRCSTCSSRELRTRPPRRARLRLDPRRPPDHPDRQRDEGRPRVHSRYMTLATADADGTPWACPVWFARPDERTFLWASDPDARHSRNIAANPRIALVIFDSTVDPGDAAALYVAAHRRADHRRHRGLLRRSRPAPGPRRRGRSRTSPPPPGTVSTRPPPPSSGPSAPATAACPSPEGPDAQDRVRRSRLHRLHPQPRRRRPHPARAARRHHVRADGHRRRAAADRRDRHPAA